MVVLVSLIVLLRGLPCFHDFSHGASHPYIPISFIFALVPHIFDGSLKPSYAHAYIYIRRLARKLRFINHVLFLDWTNVVETTEPPCDHFLAAHTNLEITVNDCVHSCMNCTEDVFVYGQTLHYIFKNVLKHQ